MVLKVDLKDYDIYIKYISALRLYTKRVRDFLVDTILEETIKVIVVEARIRRDDTLRAPRWENMEVCMLVKKRERKRKINPGEGRIFCMNCEQIGHLEEKR